ncbi:hypothetical protein IWZ01DRAFT_540604 [Phyllosticta capitalensis]
MPGNIIHYSQEELRHLAKSPRVHKPLWLPTLDELMEKKKDEASFCTLEGIVQRPEEERSFARSLKSFQTKMDNKIQDMGDYYVTARTATEEAYVYSSGARQQRQQINDHIGANIKHHMKTLKALGVSNDAFPGKMVTTTIMMTQERMDEKFAQDVCNASDKLLAQYIDDSESINKRWNEAVEYSFDFDHEASKYLEGFKLFCEKVGERMTTMADESKSSMELPPMLGQVVKDLVQQRIRLEKGITVMTENLEGFDVIMVTALDRDARTLARAHNCCRRLDGILQSVKERALQNNLDGIADATKEKSENQVGGSTRGRWLISRTYQTTASNDK